MNTHMIHGVNHTHKHPLTHPINHAKVAHGDHPQTGATPFMSITQERMLALLAEIQSLKSTLHLAKQQLDTTLRGTIDATATPALFEISSTLIGPHTPRYHAEWEHFRTNAKGNARRAGYNRESRAAVNGTTPTTRPLAGLAPDPFAAAQAQLSENINSIQPSPRPALPTPLPSPETEMEAQIALIYEKLVAEGVPPVQANFKARQSIQALPPEGGSSTPPQKGAKLF